MDLPREIQMKMANHAQYALENIDNIIADKRMYKSFEDGSKMFIVFDDDDQMCIYTLIGSEEFCTRVTIYEYEHNTGVMYSFYRAENGTFDRKMNEN